MDTPSLPSQFEYLAVSTPLLASQNQPLYEYDLSGTATATPPIPSTSSLDNPSPYGYPPFSSTQNPLFSSPPAAPVPHLPSSGTGDSGNNQGSAFSPTNNSMPNYFTQQQHYPNHNRHAQYFDSNLIITPGSLSSPEENSGMMAEDQGGMFMDATMQGQEDNTNTGINGNKAWLWDSYPTTNPTPSLEALIEQQLHMDTLSPGPQQNHVSADQQQFYQLQSQELQQQQQQQQQQLLQSPPMIGSMTPPMTPHPPHRLFHSQSQPGLRALQQQQQKQQLQQQQSQQQQQNLRRRQHSVHFPSEFLSGDLGNMRPNRHVSLPVGSYSAPVPSLASLSEMMRDSPSGGSTDLLAAGNGPTTMAETATLLSMSLPAAGFSFLDSPPPPMLHHHHHHMHFQPTGMHQHFLPTSPPLTSSTDISGASTPKSRSRAGSKSRSRPTSASSIATVRNASAPYSPSTTPGAMAAASRSPSLIPLSPIPPFKLGSATADSDLGPPPKPAYETGLIVLPGSLGAATATGAASPGSGAGAATVGTGGKAKRISRTKLPTSKSRSRSSTISNITSPVNSSAIGTPSESTAAMMNSPFSLVLSEQDEKTLQGLADQAAANNHSAMNSSELHFVPPPPALQHHSAPIILGSHPHQHSNGDVDPFQLEASVQLQSHSHHQHQQQHHSHHQQHPLDPNMFELSLMSDLEEGSDLDEEGVDGEEDDDTLTTPNAHLMNTNVTTPSDSSSSSSPAPTPATTEKASSGKPIPCPFPSCPKSFTRHFNLTAHVKSHETLKPYSCHVCPRVFSRKHDLQRHIRVHTGSKPYVCVNCQKAFARTDALCRHYKTEEACRNVMSQDDDIKKQAQQQIQQQLHQEQIELQQAQQAHAQAQAALQQQQQQQAVEP
ncbi:hypothetical protein EMPS_08808 [Entomortierella parvispora]|uniref:C2H2-type domain-containing protein n=1 Tax=Entomortierella parvispora TaxID=205924 RepID=A0A9P3LZN2_9FUNG|nr:hypothetical protein EMPS_08808 [Entomortierella parvispora]